MFEVIATLDRLGAGYVVESKAFFDSLNGNLFGLFFLYSKQEKIKARATTHRSEVNDFVFDVAIANDYGKEMLYRMQRLITDIIASVWLFETQVVGLHAVCLSQAIKSRGHSVVIEFERFYIIHNNFILSNNGAFCNIFFYI